MNIKRKIKKILASLKVFMAKKNKRRAHKISCKEAGRFKVKILEKNRRVCAHCGKRSSLEIHCKNLDKKDKRIDNFIILCKPCHEKIHKAIEDFKKAGYIKFLK